MHEVLYYERICSSSETKKTMSPLAEISSLTSKGWALSWIFHCNNLFTIYRTLMPRPEETIWEVVLGGNDEWFWIERFDEKKLWYE